MLQWPRSNNYIKGGELNKYRKKTPEVDAFQMTPERRYDFTEWPSWLKKAWYKPGTGGVRPVPSVLVGSNDTLTCETLDGLMWINLNDWIIRHGEDELYPCKSHVFPKIYEKVLDN